jgi:hypothetical protein
MSILKPEEARRADRMMKTIEKILGRAVPGDVGSVWRAARELWDELDLDADDRKDLAIEHLAEMAVRTAMRKAPDVWSKSEPDPTYGALKKLLAEKR